MTFSNKKNEADEFPPFFIEQEPELKNYIAHLSSRLGIQLNHVEVLDNGASLRKYWLLKDSRQVRYVLSFQGDNFKNLLKYSITLSNAGIHTPEVIIADPPQQIVLQEYLPDECSLLHKNSFSSTELKKTAKLLKSYRSLNRKDFPRSFLSDIFDKEWFDLIQPIFWGNQFSSSLQRKLYHTLKRAFSVEEFPGHRDFQSSNIFFIDKEIYVIDFQDSMLLHPFYDIASFIWDSYLSIKYTRRMEMAKEILETDFSTISHDDFLLISLQRKLHDLAAFIRAIKNKKGRFAHFVKPTVAMIDRFFMDLNMDIKSEEIWNNSLIQKCLSLQPDLESD